MAIAKEKSLPLAIGLNVLLPGLGYMYMGKWLVGPIACVLLIAIYSSTGLILTVQTWIGINIIMLIDMLILTRRNKNSVLEQTTKKCPYCAERIQREAIICRFCNTKLDGELVKPLASRNAGSSTSDARSTARIVSPVNAQPPEDWRKWLAIAMMAAIIIVPLSAAVYLLIGEGVGSIHEFARDSMHRIATSMRLAADRRRDTAEERTVHQASAAKETASSPPAVTDQQSSGDAWSREAGQTKTQTAAFLISTYRREGMPGIVNVIQDCYGEVNARVNQTRHAAARDWLEVCMTLDLMAVRLDTLLGSTDRSTPFFSPENIGARVGRIREFDQSDGSEISLKIDRYAKEAATAMDAAWTRVGGVMPNGRIARPNDTRATDAASRATVAASDALKAYVSRFMRECGDAVFIATEDLSGTFWVMQLQGPSVVIKSNRELTDADKLNGIEWDGLVQLRSRATRRTSYKAWKNEWTNWAERGKPAAYWNPWQKPRDDDFVGGWRKRNGVWEIYRTGASFLITEIDRLAQPPSCEEIGRSMATADSRNSQVPSQSTAPVTPSSNPGVGGE